jgi:hypothetical protein
MASSNTPGVLYALLGLNRAGQILYISLFVLAIPALTAYSVLLPRLVFSAADEQLFFAARHGDTHAIDEALKAGAHVNRSAPIDRKTALFRAAVFGHADAVRFLLTHGADVSLRGSDGKSIVEIVETARASEKDPAVAQALDAVAAALREGHAER